MSRRHKKHHEDHDEHPSEAWLIALADMMTLLMVTFLMMFAISSLDLKKFQTFKEAFAKGTGASLPHLPGEGVPTVGDITDVAKAPADASAVPVSDAYTATTGGKILDPQALDELRKKVAAELEKAGLAGMVEAKLDARGLVLYVTSAVLFDSGEADVTRVGRALLDALGPVLKGVANPVVVEGHTDSRPISSARFASNWELSAMRATAVARQLMEAGEISRKRVSIAGYADTRPRQARSTSSAYALNRRVEIVIQAPTPKPVVKAAGPEAAGPEAAGPEAAGTTGSKPAPASVPAADDAPHDDAPHSGAEDSGH